MLNPTPTEKLCDPEGRPYFLWDTDTTLQQLHEHLRADDEDERLYWMGVLLRQAKPDDAIVLAGRPRITEAVPRLRGRLGRTEPFWVWLTERWAARG